MLEYKNALKVLLEKSNAKLDFYRGLNLGVISYEGASCQEAKSVAEYFIESVASEIAGCGKKGVARYFDGKFSHLIECKTALNKNVVRLDQDGLSNELKKYSEIVKDLFRKNDQILTEIMAVRKKDYFAHGTSEMRNVATPITGALRSEMAAIRTALDHLSLSLSPRFISTSNERRRAGLMSLSFFDDEILEILNLIQQVESIDK